MATTERHFFSVQPNGDVYVHVSVTDDAGRIGSDFYALLKGRDILGIGYDQLAAAGAGAVEAGPKGPAVLRAGED